MVLGIKLVHHEQLRRAGEGEDEYREEDLWTQSSRIDRRLCVCVCVLQLAGGAPKNVRAAGEGRARRFQTLPAHHQWHDVDEDAMDGVREGAQAERPAEEVQQPQRRHEHDQRLQEDHCAGHRERLTGDVRVGRARFARTQPAQAAKGGKLSAVPMAMLMQCVPLETPPSTVPVAAVVETLAHRPERVNRLVSHQQRPPSRHVVLHDVRVVDVVACDGQHVHDALADDVEPIEPVVEVDDVGEQPRRAHLADLGVQLAHAHEAGPRPADQDDVVRRVAVLEPRHLTERQVDEGGRAQIVDGDDDGVEQRPAELLKERAPCEAVPLEVEEAMHQVRAEDRMVVGRAHGVDDQLQRRNAARVGAAVEQAREILDRHAVGLQAAARDLVEPRLHLCQVGNTRARERRTKRHAPSVTRGHGPGREGRQRATLL